MAKILAWCDAPTAKTGFGRSASHVLHALHDAGHEIIQLAVNLDIATMQDIPWKVYAPHDRGGDPYGLSELTRIILTEKGLDMLWTTFDPELPWKYPLPGTQPPTTVMNALHSLKTTNPGFRTMGWFPVDGGPLSEMEEAVLGATPYFDAPVTMSPHVHELIEWTAKLAGRACDMDAVRKRLQVIPHGVDLTQYRVASAEDRADAKRRIGIDPDTFIILQLERNQQRKANWLAMEVMEHLFTRRPKLRGRTMLYQHMLEDEEAQGSGLGYNLPQLAPRYGLQRGRDIRWPVGGGVPEEEMSRTVYACADVFLSVSTGEGFQYPAWEALACGVPLVLPNDSARKAWFTSVPNVHLYRTDERGLVQPRSYGRRMGFPVSADAANTILNLMDARRPKFQRRSEEGRAYVEKVANLPDVQRAWVELVAEQEEILTNERRAMSLAVPGDSDDYLVTMEHGPGHGDLIMAAPALAALRKHGTVRLRVDRDKLELASVMGMADSYETHATPSATFQNGPLRIDDLYHPKHQGTWSHPLVNRTETIAQHLGVSIDDLEPFQMDLPTELLQQARAQLLDAYSVDPSLCVGLAFESGSMHRAIPRSYISQMFPHLKAMELVPVILGLTPMGIQTTGVIDLTGKTNLTSLLGVLGVLGAVVSADSGIMHMAAAVGTPTVGLFTSFLPQSRLKYYATPTVPVIPLEQSLDGESFPAGKSPAIEPGRWSASITPDRIADALRTLLGLSPLEAPALIMPGGVTE